MSQEKILDKVKSLTSSPMVFQADWDGDSTGWFVRFSAVTEDGQTHFLGIFSEGGDIRLFNGQVPPWPEAMAAQRLGQELAGQYGAEFYFPSPDHPEEDCPHWKQRDKGYPCRRCNTLLLQDPLCPWHGLCFHCHLGEEREQREAKWTPEQRSGPRCHICGNPATSELNGGPACAGCLNKYEVYKCEKCEGVTMLAKSIGHSSLCSRCELQIALDSLSEAQRNAIRDAMTQGQLKAIQFARELMGCSLYQAQSVLRLLGDSNQTEKPV